MLVLTREMYRKGVSKVLLSFSVGNYLSFNEVTTLSLEGVKAHNECPENVVEFPSKDLRILKNILLFGANGSGKSNLLNAMGQLRKLVLVSSKDTQVGEPLGISPFLLAQNNEKEPSIFEVEFLMETIKYRYGVSLDDQKIYEEWLYITTRKSNEKEVFFRKGKEIIVPRETKTSFLEAEPLKKMVRENALFLSVAAQFDIELAVDILQWFDRWKFFASGGRAGKNVTIDILENEALSDEAKEHIKKVFSNVSDVIVKEQDQSQFERLPNEMQESLKKDVPEDILKKLYEKDKEVYLSYPVYNGEKERIGNLLLDPNLESSGTKKFLSIIGVIVKALHEPLILFVDEFEARSHPMLTKYLLNLFLSSKNKARSQLIITTHDAGLLRENCLRRDQVYFVDKNRFGESELTSLADFRVRKDQEFYKNYMEGRFGGVPDINFLEFIKRGED